MQSVEDRVTPLSVLTMAQEEELGQQLQESALAQPEDILHLPNIHTLMAHSQANHDHLQKEFFSLKIRNCPLFNAVPLPHIGKKVLPNLSQATNGVVSSKESLNLHFLPENQLLEKIFSYFDSTSVAGWQEKSQAVLSQLGKWSASKENFVQFAHFWLSELQHDQKQQLLELELGVIEDEVHLAFLEGLDSKDLQPSELSSILLVALSEYPMGLASNQHPYIFLDYLNLMSSPNASGYREMLSNIQYPSKNPQITQWLLAIREFALANLWHAMVKFYKALVSTQLSSEAAVQSPSSVSKQEATEGMKERALQAVQWGYADVLDYLVRSQKLDLSIVDEKNRNLLFLATIYDQSKILEYFLEMALPVPDINQAAENGNTPLHAAVNTGKMHLISLLLHYPGINVNVQNPQCDGATPLHLAIVYGHLGICYLLLNAAADVNSVMGGLAPLQLAEMFGNEAITGLIKMHAKKTQLENTIFARSASEGNSIEF
ncbi:uncharacterized protein LOC113425272 [Notechis scutatus]|uniref:Uncharacterized protein LOC113425272 n=1 Tax=Notechis scutatus TaxID=8663 RepID=A0A6J1VIZ3_9SAUR|nr:uncharacterized protein LOC113425272 [Notechis scutatus]